MDSRGGVARRRPGGFTVVEVLVVIAIVVVLMSLLFVAVRAAGRSAQGANTRALMNSISQALVRFQGDIGYLPPVLGDPTPTDLTVSNHDLRKLFDPRGADDAGFGWGNNDDVLPQKPDGTDTVDLWYRDNVQEWYSVTSLAEYLIGYGYHAQDGYGKNPSGAFPDEVPGLGIRNPGSDGVWGATVYYGSDPPGCLRGRMKYPTSGDPTAPTSNFDVGRVYGPYLELKDDRLLAAVTAGAGGNLVVSFPGDAGFDPFLPRTIVDYWGTPIRYYRTLYAPGALATPYRPVGPSSGNSPPYRPTLADVFVLRPYNVPVGAAVDGLADRSGLDGGDTTTTMALASARFALLSAGPDRTLNPDLRHDAPDDGGNTRGTSYANEDNIVEAGP